MVQMIKVTSCFQLVKMKVLLGEFFFFDYASVKYASSRLFRCKNAVFIRLINNWMP